MIDTSDDAWFDLDLAHYLDNVPHSAVNQNVSVEWMKNRNASVPPDVAEHL